MKLNKTFGRIATTLVATAMLASLAAPVYAATTSVGRMTYESNSVTFSAKVTADENVTLPSGNLTFTLAGMTTETLPAADADVTNGDAIPGDVSDVAESTVSVNVAESANVTFTFKEDAFDKVGVYFYTVTQNESGITGMNEDTSTYILKVYVKNNVSKTGFEIANVTMYKQDASETKLNSISNTYETESLKLTKTISGDAADMKKNFSFQIVLTDPDKTESLNGHAVNVTYSINGNSETANASFVKGVATITLNEQLGNNDYITVTGLPVGTDYTISETDASAYVTTWSGSSIDTENASTHDTKNVAGDITDGENVITVNNARDSVTPTGLVMDIAPYVLLVVVAAAGCFVFLRKRRED